MAVIVDASIQGKLQHPIMPNVLTSNDRADLSRGTAGTSKLTQENADKINREKGIFPIPAQVKGSGDGASLGHQIAAQNTVGISEQFKGQNINAIA